jgi:hypothetical protein
LIWIQYAKSRKEIRKQKKEKEERRKINKKAKRKRTGPVQLSARGPASPPEPVCCVFPLSH